MCSCSFDTLDNLEPFGNWWNSASQNGLSNNVCKKHYALNPTQGAGCNAYESHSADNYFTGSNLPRGNPRFSSTPDTENRFSMTVNWDVGSGGYYEYIVMVVFDSLKTKIYAAKDLFVVKNGSDSFNLCSTNTAAC